jgi:hypothetical protein
MGNDASEVSDLLALSQAAKGLMASPGWETFLSHLERKSRDLYLAAIASPDQTVRLRSLDQAAVLHELMEGFGLEADQWDQILHRERMVEDQQYRLRAQDHRGQPKPYNADMEALRLSYQYGQYGQKEV